MCIKEVREKLLWTSISLSQTWPVYLHRDAEDDNDEDDDNDDMDEDNDDIDDDEDGNDDEKLLLACPNFVCPGSHKACSES